MPATRFRIFDAHVNVGMGEPGADPIKTGISDEYILQLMLESDVEQSLIFPASRPQGYAEANKEVAGYVRQHPRQFLGFGRIRSEPANSSRRFRFFGIRKLAAAATRLSEKFPAKNKRFDRECQDELRRCFEDYGLRGIKIHPVEDGFPSKAVLAALHSYKKPVLLHCGRGVSFRRIEKEILKPFDMPVILAHMGGYPADRKRYFKALDLARNYPQLYLNTSFVFYQYILEAAMTTCPAKIIFGSDAPGVHPLTAVSTILSLRISDEAKQMVFRDNMMRLLEA